MLRAKRKASNDLIVRGVLCHGCRCDNYNHAGHTNDLIRQHTGAYIYEVILTPYFRPDPRRFLKPPGPDVSSDLQGSPSLDLGNMFLRYNRPSCSSVDCIFCGVTVISCNEDFAPTKPSKRWLSEFRACKYFPKCLESFLAKKVVVYNECGEWDSPKLSGIGDRSIDDAVPVQVEKHRREYGSEPSAELCLVWVNPSEPHRPLKRQARYPVKLTWGYFGHVSCWALFQALCAPREIDLESLNKLCRSIPMRMCGLGLDYGRIPFTFHWSLRQEDGAEPDIDNLHTDWETMDSRRAPMYTSDPLKLNLNAEQGWKRSYRQSRLRNLDNWRKFYSGIPSFINGMWFEKHPPAQNDFFQKLPLEILCLILTHLPSRDVLSAKIASSTLAPIGLSTAFWESRFHAGHEFHCIFERPFPVKTGDDWKTLFKTSRDTMATWPFKNRHRIWNSLVQLKDILSQISSRPLYGKALRTYFERHHPKPPQVQRNASAEVSFPRIPGKKTENGTIAETRDTGCKVLYSRLAIIPADVKGISATIVHHGKRKFIAGIRFQSRESGDIGIGYLSDENQESLNFEGKSLCGFKISVSAAGICGISVVLDAGLCPPALGYKGTLPVTRVLIRRGERFTVKCDFDGLKMLTFGIKKVRTGTKNRQIQGRQHVHRDDYLWSPTIPKPCFHLSELNVYDKEKEAEVFCPRMHCMFGGTSGERLSTITKLTFWFEGEFLVGIEFHYDDVSTILGCRFPLSHVSAEEAIRQYEYESMRSWHVNYMLDGPGGEVITGFSVPNASFICNLQVHTNFRRKIVVPPRRRHPDNFEDSDPPEAIRPPPSTTIVGVYTNITENYLFGSLGVISI